MGEGNTALAPGGIMSLNLMHFVQQLFQHPQAGQAASNAHAQVQQLPAQHAVQLHQLLQSHPAVQAHLQVQAQHSPANLGVPYGNSQFGAMLNQGGAYNPGLVHMQAGMNPQIGAFQDQPGQLNASLPQYRIQPGQEWLPSD